MKNIICTLVYSLSYTLTFGQGNLVPNGSFESPSVPYSAIGFTSILNNCFLSAGATPPDDWRADIPDPDRMKEGTIYCLRDNDLAQDGDYYVVLQNSESIEVTLDSALREGCLYQFSCYLNLETNRGTQNNPSRVMFFFSDPDGNSIQSPIINWNVWQYFATFFTSMANSNTLEIANWVAFSATAIDFVSVVLLGCPSLPVEWLYVRAKNNGIEWATATQTNCDVFKVYRFDGTMVATVDCKQNTSFATYYSVSDLKAGWYIIRQSDIDGKFQYSKPVLIKDAYDETDATEYRYNILGQRLR